MVLGDPALIVLLGTGGNTLAAGGERLALDDLGLLGGSGLLGLGEEGLDVGLVDKVRSTSESGTEDEVQEDDLRVKDAGGSLDDADLLVGNANLEDVSALGGNDGAQVETEVLGVHVQDERVGKRLSLAGGDDGVVSDGAQVADDADRRVSILRQRLQGVERTTDKCELDGLILVVGNLDHGLGGTSVDQLDAKDVGLGEGSRDVGLELGGVLRAASIGIERLWRDVMSACAQGAVTRAVDSFLWERGPTES